MDVVRYAGAQGDLLRREFPHTWSTKLAPVVLPSGPAWHRTFAWTPPDGVPVQQRQLYFVAPQTGLTATATTPESQAHRLNEVFGEVLRRAILW